MKFTAEELTNRANNHLADIYDELYGKDSALIHNPKIRSKQILSVIRTLADCFQQLENPIPKLTELKRTK